MSIRNLDKMFNPRSVAVIGASDKPKSIGAALMDNMLRAGYRGPVLPVNPHATATHGIMAYKDVASLPMAPDLAVLATPPDTIAPMIGELGARGTRAAVILTAGFAEGETKVGKERAAELLAAARPHLLRVVGPNCLGIAMPGIGLDATFAPAPLLAGNIAFLTQSGAMATTVLDWALPRGIGFSAVVSMGDMADVDFGDLLDYFALDSETEAILIYAEAVTHARKFMSAARRAARVKPVIVVKGGRAEEGARAATSHTGALAGADVVYEAAFRRAGMLRVNEVEELFDAATTLARYSPQRGNRLAIVTNGGGAGVLATDRLIEEGGRLAALSPATIEKLNAVLPATWSHGNPIDIIGDADAERYANALSVVMEDEDKRRRGGALLPDRGGLGGRRRQGRDERAGQAGRAEEERVRQLDGRDKRGGRARGAGGRGRAGLRDAGARGARLHVSGALPAEPGTAAGDALDRRARRRSRQR